MNLDQILVDETFSPLQHKIVLLLTKRGPMIRDNIAIELKRPRSTILDQLTALEVREVVSKYMRPINERGHPYVFYKIREDSHLIINQMMQAELEFQRVYEPHLDLLDIEVKAILWYQRQSLFRPFTCLHDATHDVLAPKKEKKQNRVILECPTCGYKVEFVPQIMLLGYLYRRQKLD